MNNYEQPGKKVLRKVRKLKKPVGTAEKFVYTPSQTSLSSIPYGK